MKRFVIVCLLLCLVLGMFAGCHGSMNRSTFVIPDALDTTRNFEITFWAKNESNLTQAEVYQAGGDGLNPEAKLLIPYDRDYKGERELIYRGERWKVLRSDPYKEYNGVILLLKRSTGNAGGSVVGRYA